MARRPKRSLTDELTHHATVAAATRDAAGALALMQPDIPEFAVARRMLDDGWALLIGRLRASIQSQAQPPLDASTDQAQP